MPETKMADEQYLETQRRLLRLSYELARLDLDGFVARAEESLAAGADVDPIAYRHGAAPLRVIADLARRGRGLKSALDGGGLDVVGALADAFAGGPRRGSGAAGGGVDPCAAGGGV